MCCFVDLAHSSAAKQLSELIATHFACLRDLLPQLGHDVRNHYGGADEYVVRIVHHQHSTSWSEIPLSLRPGDQHADRIHRRRYDSCYEHLRRRRRDDCCEHQDDGAYPGNLGENIATDRDSTEMKHDAERERGKNHVPQPDIEDEAGVSIALSCVGKERERNNHAGGGDPIADVELEPPSAVGINHMC